VSSDLLRRAACRYVLGPESSALAAASSSAAAFAASFSSQPLWMSSSVEAARCPRLLVVVPAAASRLRSAYEPSAAATQTPAPAHTARTPLSAPPSPLPPFCDGGSDGGGKCVEPVREWGWSGGGDNGEGDDEAGSEGGNEVASGESEGEGSGGEGERGSGEGEDEGESENECGVGDGASDGDVVGGVGGVPGGSTGGAANDAFADGQPEAWQTDVQYCVAGAAGSTPLEAAHRTQPEKRRHGSCAVLAVRWLWTHSGPRSNGRH